MDNRIKVGVRIRPLSMKESQETTNTHRINILANEGNGQVLLTNGKDELINNVRNKNIFQFDWSFGPNSMQDRIYQDMCSPLILKIFEGYNATFFAYGQTGAGKTFTMGTTSDFNQGVMPSAIRDIFRKRDELLTTDSSGFKTIKIELSYLEIYLEDCYDLLSKENIHPAVTATVSATAPTITANNANPSQPSVTTSQVIEKKVLNVRETNAGETYLDGLTALPINNVQEVTHYLNIANKVRSTGKTAMNNASSRSHAICIISVSVTKTDGSTLVSKLNLVDLAGSERAKKTQATGEVFQEGISINKGLLALGNVVAALSARAARQEQPKTGNRDSQQHIHVPYRESKLTRLLKDSLGGNSYTVLLACLSPASQNYDESLNTLRFASRASSIMNMAKINLQEQQQMMIASQQGHEELQQLRDELATLQEKYNNLLLSSLEKQQQEEEKAKTSFSCVGGSSISSEQIFNYSCSLAKLNNSLKLLLTYCFSEDLFIELVELQHISQELEDIRHMFNIDYERPKLDPMMLLMGPDGSENEEDQRIMQELMKNLDMKIPDILSIIDEIKFLQNYFEDYSQKAVASIQNSMTTDTCIEDPAGKRQLLLEAAPATIPVSCSSRSNDHDQHVFAIPALPVSKSKANIGKLADTKQMLASVEQMLGSITNQKSSIPPSRSMEEDEGLLNISYISRDANTSSHEHNLSSASFDLSHDEAAIGNGLAVVPVSSEECQKLEQDIFEHEEQLTNMLVLTEQYQTTIQELQKEIHQLESDKQQIQVKQQKLSTQKPSSFVRPTSSFGGASMRQSHLPHQHQQPSQQLQQQQQHQQIQYKQELKQKQQLLEEKMKLLTKKEKEFQKIIQSKETLMQKMNEMNTQLLTYKQSKVTMIKQLHEKEISNQQKSKEYQKQEQQLQKQLTVKTMNIQSLNQQLMTKERLYQSSLTQKEKEMNWLRELLLSKEKYLQQTALRSQQPQKLKTGAKATHASSSNPTMTFQKQFNNLFTQSIQLEKTITEKRSLLSYQLEKKANYNKQKTHLENLLKELIQSQKKTTRISLKKQFALEKLIQQVNGKISEQQEMIKQLQSEMNRSSKVNENNSLENNAALYRLLDETIMNAMSGNGNNGGIQSTSSSSGSTSVAGSIASLSSQMKNCFQKLFQQFTINLQEKEKLSLALKEYQLKEMNLKKSIKNPDHIDAIPPEEDYLTTLFPTEDIQTLEDFHMYYDYSRRIFQSVEMNSISSVSYHLEDNEDDSDERSHSHPDEGKFREEDLFEEKQLDDTFYPSDEDEDEDFDVREDSEDDEDYGGRKRKKPNNKKMIPNKTTAKRVRKQRDSMASVGSGDRETEEVPSEEELQITESESEGDDDYPRKRAMNKKNPAATRKRKAANKEEDNLVDERNAIGTEGEEVRSTKKTKKAALISSDVLSAINQEEYEKWNNLNVKQLKVELANRKLPVSGLKTELIQRLMDHSQRSSEKKENPIELRDENTIPSKDQNEVKRVPFSELTNEMMNFNEIIQQKVISVKNLPISSTENDPKIAESHQENLNKKRLLTQATNNIQYYEND